MFTDAVNALQEEATATNERRLIVVMARAESTCVEIALEICRTWGLTPGDPPVISDTSFPGHDTIQFDEIDRILGSTLPGVIYCGHQSLDPNTLTAAVGAITGGGVGVICCPRFESWKQARDAFASTLAVPPYSVDEVAGNFRARFIESLKQFRGIAIFDGDDGTILDDGLTKPAPVISTNHEGQGEEIEPFSRFAVRASRTPDQYRAITALASLTSSSDSVVLTADRGRGKSAALGIAAAEFADMGHSIIVTAPRARNTDAIFKHAAVVLEAKPDVSYAQGKDGPEIRVDDAGSIVFERPESAVTDTPEFLFIDEAAAIGLPLLDKSLNATNVAYATTTHGYEGTGQRFAVTFEPRLENAREKVRKVSLRDPIRFAPSDPIEPWLFHTVLLNATAIPNQVITDCTLDSVRYEALEATRLSSNESLLRQVFGLLNHAHYKTEPSDVVRLLDAPNIIVRALLDDEYVVAVAMLAREGNFDPDTQQAINAGERIRGNVIPDLLSSQLRDETAGLPTGLRVVRIATHPGLRREGFGSALLTEIQDEFSGAIDWVGTSFGATPELLSFWEANGFGMVHVSITRNQTTGSHSAVMLSGVSETGVAVLSRHSDWFANRLCGLVVGAYRSLDPAVLIAAIRSVQTDVTFELSEREQSYVSGSIEGPGLYDLNPAAFRKLGLNYFLTTESPQMSREAERFVVVRLLQDRDWNHISDMFSYQSERAYNKAIPEIVARIIDVLDSP